MLDKLFELYESGELSPNGLFAKTAAAIAREELDKVAGAFDFLKRGPGKTNLDMLIRDVIKSSPSTDAAISTISKLRGLTPAEQGLIVAERINPTGLLGKIKARISANPSLAKGLGVGAAIAGVGLASHFANKAEEKKREAEELASLSSVLKKNPDFDKKKSKDLFSVLQDVAPSLASNPVATEGFIEPHLQWPTLPYTAIKDISQIEFNANKRKDDGGIFEDAFKEIGGALASLLSLGS